MRRPHVYERSMPRAGNPAGTGHGDDYTLAARAPIAAVPDLLRQAEACGAVALARYLGQALSEAEGVNGLDLRSRSRQREKTLPLTRCLLNDPEGRSSQT